MLEQFSSLLMEHGVQNKASPEWSNNSSSMYCHKGQLSRQGCCCVVVLAVERWSSSSQRSRPSSDQVRSVVVLVGSCQTADVEVPVHASRQLQDDIGAPSLLDRPPCSPEHDVDTYRRGSWPRQVLDGVPDPPCNRRQVVVAKGRDDQPSPRTRRSMLTSRSRTRCHVSRRHNSDPDPLGRRRISAPPVDRRNGRRRGAAADQPDPVAERRRNCVHTMDSWCSSADVTAAHHDDRSPSNL